ncbi:3-keto-disaccharide hydrolase [Spirosoma endbachense]|uniref:DUF1080 domain-containing protein n=1 Tax=Spirosoma endbachense TaxID=2666025 RepID=A0A6P1W834_9BACT|nr:DUF1080 domain-containing protein [Spirosoma endbachense]QHW00071.1 DUF1080 domain-containing protein [Spirosoma endbachense]
MRNIRNLVLILITLTLAGLPATAQKSEGDWEILFNGKDFTGWKHLNGNHKVEVKDGMIVGTVVPGEPNGFLCTEKEFGDFILELDVSIDTTMNNSGIQFRSLSTLDYLNYRLHGYQMEVDPKPQRWSGSIYDEARRGWLYTTELNLPSKTAFKNNAWNHYRIECFGTSNRTWVNDVAVSHLIDDETLKGMIGLQLHSNNPNDPIPPGNHQIRFKNIRIKTRNIKPSPPDDIFIVNLIPNDLSEAEKRAGYGSLFDGKTAQGLTGASNSKFPDSDWVIEQGTLTIKESKRNEKKSVFLKNPYAAFELKFEFRLAEGADSGVKYLLSKAEENAEGLEFQIQDDMLPGNVPRGKDLTALGSVKGLAESKQTIFSKRRIGLWSNAMIRVYPDNRVEHWINGFKMADYKGKPHEKGFLMLENNGLSVSYRSIKIKELR